ncbi:hypothetical protein GPA10_33605 [Streptomyces sp. p1417]|uniref:Serine/threonine protein kinase n=1 Tax=Streptomyces typhae TaxID=2681492 RepID=A0A6L6X6P5_9ACTN|nr:hypothetical protein [Streptomyces typhae]MVO89555.1 hypothetical protein [Streptomyces typhae]
MKRSGPLYTLLAGLVLALFMLSVNATSGTGSSSYGESAPGTAPPPATSAPAKSPAPARTATPPEKPERSPLPAEARYTGRTDDDTASVAVTVRGGKAVAYFCDGRSTESWLKGNADDDGSLRLTGKRGAKLDGRLSRDNGEVRGTVVIRGKAWDFTAPRAGKPAGVYRATAEVRGEETDGGWIVQPDGSQVGILTRGGATAAAPRLDPDTGAVVLDDGGTLTARPVVP